MKRFNLFVVAGLIFALFLAPLTACTAGQGHQKSQPQATSAFDVTPEEAWKIIQENKGNPQFVILDVRTPKEFYQGHIAHAINIDYYDLTFKQRVEKLDPSKTYLVYCSMGGRSASARKIMLEMGFKNVYNMLEGILGWSKKGLPVVKEP